ncbi:MAG: polysaccharide deacetylase family protein [Chitinophagaceae bacterium]
MAATENQERAGMSVSTISIDWEDFGQLFCMYHHGIIGPPSKAIERQTNIILHILEERGVKATFFVLGMLAKFRGDLVRKIAAQGHEIGIHGQNHQAMFTLTPDQAYVDLSESLKLVQDITGQKIYGYRAPFFSINESNLYVLEMLADLGLEYDSSIFPMKLSRYGIAGFNPKNTLYKLPNGKTIIELPLTIGNYFNKKVPIAGGGYMRAMPKFLVHKVFDDLNKSGVDSMMYMHPYEFDTEIIDVTSNYPPNASYSKAKTTLLNFKWNVFRNSIRDKIRMLLKEYKFATCIEKVNYVKNNGNSPVLLGR